MTYNYIEVPNLPFDPVDVLVLAGKQIPDWGSSFRKLIGAGTCPSGTAAAVFNERTEKCSGLNTRLSQYPLLLEVVPTPAVHNTRQCLNWKQIVGLLPLVP